MFRDTPRLQPADGRMEDNEGDETALHQHSRATEDASAPGTAVVVWQGQGQDAGRLVGFVLVGQLVC